MCARFFGLSTVELVFGEETTNFENRERVPERLVIAFHQVKSVGAHGYWRFARFQFSASENDQK